MKKEYNRYEAIKYAKKWVYGRNPHYSDFEKSGGDCTNFISQCIFAGSKVMNFNRINGWYYINGKNKSPSWSGVEFLYRFLVNNKRKGPQGKEVTSREVYPGDVAQLSFNGKIFEHSLLILNHSNSLDELKIATHTYDVYGKKIVDYNYSKIRFIHISRILI